MSKYSHFFHVFLSKGTNAITVDLKKEDFKKKCSRVAEMMGVEESWDNVRDCAVFKFDNHFKSYLIYTNKSVTYSDIAEYLCRQHRVYEDIRKEGK